MRIAIIGAGAIGSIFGGLLSEAGYDVSLIDVWREHVEEINRRGLHIQGVSGDRVIKVRASYRVDEVGEVDLAILAVKAYNTRRSLEDWIEIFREDTVLLSIQNGLIPIEELSLNGVIRHILRGVTNHGATVIGPGKIYHAGAGPTYIGILSDTSMDTALSIVEMFNDAGIETYFHGDIESVVWSKLIVNIAVNALTALTRYRNGAVIEIRELSLLMDEAISEALKIVGELGVKLLYDDPYKYVRDVVKGTYNNKSSMLQDIERGGRTEIDYLNGAIVRLGEELGIDTPVNRVLTLLIKAVEAGSINNPGQ